MDIPHGYRPLPGSERPQVPGAQFLEDVEPAEHIGFTIRMRSRPGASAEPGLDHWQNTPAHRRHFLSTEEHMRRHGAAQEDVEAIVLFLKSHNLGVIEADAGRRRIVVEGTAANINRAFAITLKRYRAPQRHLPRPTPKLNEPDAAHVTIREHEHRGYDGPIHLPADLVGVITAVIGLDNRMVGAPAATGTGDPSSSNYLSPEVVGQTYNFPNTGAVGQTVGIFEDAASGAAYLHADITSFINSLPSGFNTLPVLSDIGLTVGATTYSNNTALVTSSPTSAVGECCIDVSIVAAIVQGGNINVYFTENTEAGWEAFLNRAIFPLPGDNAPSVLSASWLLSFGDDAGSIGDPSASGSIAHVISGLLQSAATRGITVFMAIGDWGSANQVLDGKCHVSYPNCDPWSTACGGTIIGNIATTPTRFQEFVWSDANIAASPFQFFPFVSTGGGVSDNFPVPAYQTAAGVLPISKNDGNPRRGVPDIAGMIAMNGFFFAGTGGPGQFGFVGTSLVAPLYAGLVALIVKWLGRDVGFLNPLFYSQGPAICNDVRFGDNESGNPPPDAPVYIAGPGWDACTGWGSIEGFRLLAALAPAPIIVTAIADSGSFGDVCVDHFRDEILTINNTGFSLLQISDIISSSPSFLAPSVASYPLAIEPGGSLDIVIRFQPTAPGPVGATLTILSNDLLAPHAVSVSGFAPSPRLVSAIADSGAFQATCLGSFTDEPLILNNSGRCALSIFGVTSSSPDFVVASVLSYPVVIGSGDSIALVVRLQPSSFGPKAGAITILSNDSTGPHVVAVSGVAPAPKANLIIADSGNFGDVCVGSFADEPLIITNSGKCTLSVTGISSGSGDFLVPEVLSYPITIGAGDALPVPIRFQPTSFGAKVGTITVTSDDPASPISITVSGDAPPGKLTVAGSTTFGGVNACCCADRTLSICNTGDCALQVTSVRFKRKSRHWKLLHNPFPAKLRPGSCLPVVIQYHATERCPRPCELVIESNDPATPVKFIEVLAYTIWDACRKEGGGGCRKGDCDDCRNNCCDRRPGCQQGYPCCDDDNDDDADADR